MKVLLFHCSWHNKGDVLMLLSAKKIIEEIYPQSKFYVLSFDLPEMKVLSENQIEIIDINLDKLVPHSLNLFRWYVRIYRRLKNKSIEKLNDIDLVLDLNGYFISDSFGMGGLRRYLNYYLILNSLKSKKVLLPKSFGPLSNNLLKGTCVALISSSDLVFARDTQSYAEIHGIIPWFDNLVLNSDYSSIAKPKLSDKVKRHKGQVAIIVNSRMAKPNTKEHEQYKIFILNIIKVIKKAKKKYYFLIHDTRKDYKFLNSLDVSLNAEIIISHNALELKGYASVASLVVSSRYHGILNALNSFVPVIATKWAHKYEYMMEEYGVSEYLLDTTCSFEVIEDTISKAMNMKQHHIVNKSEIEQKRKILISEIQNEIKKLFV